MTLALSLAAIGAAFLSGLALGMLEQILRRRRPVATGFSCPRYATACDAACDPGRLEPEEHPLFV
jgi:hypothetical protein